jgi:hypothetical protein
MRTIKIKNCMVQKVSGWVAFKFSLPKQDSDKTNHKELEFL